MGPGDPFSSNARAAAPERAPEVGNAPQPARTSPLLASLAGLFAGGAFATVWLVMDFGSAIAVLTCALLGMGIAWAAHGVANGRLDWRAGLSALLRRPD